MKRHEQVEFLPNHYHQHRICYFVFLEISILHLTVVKNKFCFLIDRFFSNNINLFDLILHITQWYQIYFFCHQSICSSFVNQECWALVFWLDFFMWVWKIKALDFERNFCIMSVFKDFSMRFGFNNGIDDHSNCISRLGTQRCSGSKCS